MRFITTPLAKAYFVECEPFIDERGVFARTFCREEFSEIGFDGHIEQVNYSFTRRRGTIRGMHYQLPPACETKIVRCVRGKIFDVMVDLRKGSPTFLRWFGCELTEENMRMMVVPEGYAHGFQSLTDDAGLIYLVSAPYSPVHERGLRYDDPLLAIEWPLPAGVVSERDRRNPLIDGNFQGIEP